MYVSYNRPQGIPLSPFMLIFFLPAFRAKARLITYPALKWISLNSRYEVKVRQEKSSWLPADVYMSMCKVCVFLPMKAS